MSSVAANGVAALVLAAGTASRYRALDPTVATKLVASYRGKPLVRHAVEAAVASCLGAVVVVTGHAPDAVEAALAGLPVRFVRNERYAQGLATSLAAGVAALPSAAAGAVVLLGDMPLVTAALIDRLVAAFDEDRGCAVVPSIGGVRGNPVLLPRTMFARVMQLRGDEGARRLLKDSADVREVVVDDDAVTIDVDTPGAPAG